VRDAAGKVLPRDLQPLMKRGQWLAAGMIVYLLLDVTVLYLLMGGSSSSVTALIVEDGLELVPPIAFLLSAFTRTKPPTRRYPYGYHRAVTLGSFASSLALLTFGLALLLFSARSLLQGDQGQTIGSVDVFGVDIWRGWLVMLWFVP
jgi:divalent metal cation (Fe/Co/Zn/Cd) transporter